MEWVEEVVEVVALGMQFSLHSFVVIDRRRSHVLSATLFRWEWVKEDTVRSRRKVVSDNRHCCNRVVRSMTFLSHKVLYRVRLGDR